MKIKEEERIFNPVTIWIKFETEKELRSFLAGIFPHGDVMANFNQAEGEYEEITGEDIQDVLYPVWDFLDNYDTKGENK